MGKKIARHSASRGSALRLCYAAAILLLSGCAGVKERGPLRPDVDLSPLGCGYKWFQSGYSPSMEMACDLDRSHLAEEQTELAREHAREVARNRCPTACPPVELVDPGDPGDAFPEGLCTSGFVYFTTRLFFQCGAP